MKKTKTRICKKCGKEKTIVNFYYHRTRKNYASSCKECNTKICNDYQRNSGYRSTPKYVFYQRAYEIIRKCKVKNIHYDKNIEQILYDQWEKQKGLCYYLGEPMVFQGFHKGEKNTMTVDRINPKIGYIKDNVVLCSSIINRVKQDLSLKELIKLCKKIIKHQNVGLKSEIKTSPLF